MALEKEGSLLAEAANKHLSGGSRAGGNVAWAMDGWCYVVGVPALLLTQWIIQTEPGTSLLASPSNIPSSRKKIAIAGEFIEVQRGL